MGIDFLVSDEMVGVFLSADGEYVANLIEFGLDMIDEEQFKKNTLCAHILGTLILDYFYDNDNCHPLRKDGSKTAEKLIDRIIGEIDISRLYK